MDFCGGPEGIRALYPAWTGVDKERYTWEMSDHLPLWVQIATRERREG